MRISLSYGTTRWVILIGNVAIKIARFRIFSWTLRFFKWLWRGADKKQLHKCHKNAALAALKYLLRGVTANITEYRISQTYPELEILPTFITFLGLINVQVRGETVEKRDLVYCPFRDIARAHPEKVNFRKTENFCRVGEKIFLADYGDPDLEKILRREEKIFARSHA